MFNPGEIAGFIIVVLPFLVLFLGVSVMMVAYFIKTIIEIYQNA